MMIENIGPYIEAALPHGWSDVRVKRLRDRAKHVQIRVVARDRRGRKRRVSVRLPYATVNGHAPEKLGEYLAELLVPACKTDPCGDLSAWDRERETAAIKGLALHIESALPPEWQDVHVEDVVVNPSGTWGCQIRATNSEGVILGQLVKDVRSSPVREAPKEIARMVADQFMVLVMDLPPDQLVRPSDPSECVSYRKASWQSLPA